MTTPRSARALPRTAEVVVIGGGAIGTSIAFHLAEAGVPDVVLLERDELGQGSTCKAAGGVRAQFSDRINIELGARSLEAFGRFAQRPGQEIDLHRVGYLFLLSTPAAVASFERDVALQNELGVPSRMIEVAEAEALSPLIATDGLLAAAYSPDDGHCTPESVVLGYATGARRHGATLLTGVTVTGIDVHGGEARTVHTDRGAITAGTVVCAAGAWSRAIGEMVGHLAARHAAAPPDPLHRADARPGRGRPVHHRLRDHLLLPPRGPRPAAGHVRPRPGARLPPRLLRRLAAPPRRGHRDPHPRLLDVGLGNGWAGLYEVTPDHNALIGRSTTTPNVLYATGFSGHGFLQAPAVGEVVRDLHLDRTPFVDTAPLSADRFARDGATRPESHIV